MESGIATYGQRGTGRDGEPSLLRRPKLNDTGRSASHLARLIGFRLRCLPVGPKRSRIAVRHQKPAHTASSDAATMRDYARMVPVIPNPRTIRAFRSEAAFDTWLCANHARETEIWLRIYKKGSGQPPSPTRRRWTSRCAGAGSTVSGRLSMTSPFSSVTLRGEPGASGVRSTANTSRADRGGAHEAARAATNRCRKGRWRWDAAYAPMRAATAASIPDDLRAAIESNPQASRTFRTLGRRNLFALAFRTNNMKTAPRADKKDCIAGGDAGSRRNHRPGKGNGERCGDDCLLATGIGAVAAKRRLWRNRRAWELAPTASTSHHPLDQASSQMIFEVSCRPPSGCSSPSRDQWRPTFSQEVENIMPVIAPTSAVRSSKVSSCRRRRRGGRAEPYLTRRRSSSRPPMRKRWLWVRV